MQAEQDNLFIIKHCKSVLNIFLESLGLVKAHIFLCVWQVKTFLIASGALTWKVLSIFSNVFFALHSEDD